MNCHCSSLRSRDAYFFDIPASEPAHLDEKCASRQRGRRWECPTAHGPGAP
ncbi:hypothetical protein CZ774_14335 [Frigoribacterium sp. JB110]|nr:hypothetical protein CZ774_14335 [Frigoribacterium sp. JB110]